MATPFEGYLLSGNDGSSFDYIVENGILKAKRYLWMTGAKTTDFMVPNKKTKEAFNFSQWLVRLRNRGIDIRFILTPREKERPLYKKLKDESNIEFRFCYDIHMKAIIVDGTWIYFGSANLTGAGMGSRTRKGRNNYEIGAITTDRKAIIAIEELLQEIWSGNECKDCYQKKKGYCEGI